MKASDYFGDWMKVIDSTELYNVVTHINKIDKSLLSPSPKNIFKAFQLCPYKDCKVVFIGQDPYPQEGVATGVLFGNFENTRILSPSLEIIKEAAIDYTTPHNSISFDITLESWAKQGILMINSAFTCEINKIGSHTKLWEPFMSKFINNLSILNPNLIYVLFGNQAASFKKYIQYSSEIISVYHPAYFARQNKRMPSDIFTQLNKKLKYLYNQTIKFYEEELF